MSTHTNNEHVTYDVPTLFYADDDLDDQAFVIEMMRRVNPSIKVRCFLNGLELVQTLEALPENAMLPACIVLDLNMPVWDGIHTLKILKSSKAYKTIPVFIFSTSSSDRDMKLAESLGAVAYITKPYGQKELFETCQEFAEYCSLAPRRKIQSMTTES